MILPASYANGFAPRDGHPLYPELWRGCVGAWNPGLGPSGVTLRDWSRFGLHATLTNFALTGTTSNWTPAGEKYALDFDGSNDRIAAPAFGTIGSSLTFSIWHNLTNTTAMLFNFTPTNSIANLFWLTGTLFLRGGGTTATTYIGTSTGRWMHIAAHITGTAGAIYIDGVQVSTGTVVAIGSASTGTDIGAYSDFGAGYFLNGKMDDARIYNRILTPTEIKLLASRRGIAYELAPRRRASVAVAAGGFNAAWIPRRSLVIGGGTN
jgi:hypothetical protein